MKRIYQISIILILLFEVSFFSLISTPEWFIDLNSYHRKKLILIITIGLFFIWLIVENLSRIKLRRKYKNGVIIFAISLILVSLFSAIIYNQRIIDVIGNSYFYWIILLYFFLTYFCLRNESNFTFLINSIITVGLIYGILLTLQYIFVKNGLGSFLIFHDDNLVMLSANTSPRIARPADLIAFSCTLLFVKALWERRKTQKTLMYIGLLINVFYIVIISQTRIYIIALLVTFIITLFSKKTVKNTMRKITFVLLAILISIFLTDFFMNFFSTFTMGDRLSSTMIRIEEIGFYSRQIFSNVLFGRGFIHSTSTEAIFINYGPYGIYNSSDVGFLGFISIFGLLGIVFLLIIIKNILITHKAIKRVHTLYKTLLISIVTYSLIISLTAFYTDIQRIVLLPLLLTILEFLHSQANSGIKDRKNYSIEVNR